MPNSKSGISIVVKIIFLLSIIIIIASGLILFDVFHEKDSNESYYFNNISFDYPADWEIGDNSNFDVTLEDLTNANALNIKKIDSEGYSLDIIAENISRESTGFDSVFMYKNITSVNNQRAYDIGAKLNVDGGYYTRMLVFLDENELYIFVFTCDNLEDLNSDYEVIKNSIKIK
ncbi:hypothetical protein MBCUT_07620 [Methanobrevibacter cuticularis]|uniref:PsbP C-terminal domain-containing protein n=1 Tax=Methanobrevibacter cuticularis TaxID=47311 RepID=A0A166ED89_9EURY|nr:hypothetical protein [Methanobrevibacter cuticularis]KZX16528.1 hypothetical protein MBCUT_07620 [Methanobrevibacter cuticularis]